MGRTPLVSESVHGRGAGVQDPSTYPVQCREVDGSAHISRSGCENADLAEFA